MRRCVAFFTGLFFVASLASGPTFAQIPPNDKYGQVDKFRQIDELLPTPNLYRTGAGSPTDELPESTAPQLNYDIKVTLDVASRSLRGEEKIRYKNTGRTSLHFLWLQLEPNMLRPDSDSLVTRDAGVRFNLPDELLRRRFNGGIKNLQVQALGDEAAIRVREEFTVVKTMMRLELNKPLKPGDSVKFQVKWEYRVNDAKLLPERTGYETLKSGRLLFAIAQWHPRMAAHTDYGGWQNKQFLGDGEFTLEFANYVVGITVPANYIVAATGELTNPDHVLTQSQRKRLDDAEDSDAPVFVVTPEEARRNAAANPAEDTKTWKFTAKNVRDFAFAASQDFIWDAWGVELSDNPQRKRVLAMSYYPTEAEGTKQFWSTYSTAAIAHALRTYSRRTFDYPYPVAISVNAPVFGMEYPMLSFNGPRPDRSDGGYSREQKASLIGVIIHEVGHNWFPMIVNSDERQWTWMDEGLNTFLEYLAETEWDDERTPSDPNEQLSVPDSFLGRIEHPMDRGEFPAARGNPQNPAILRYMQSTRQVPIMTNSESVHQLGNNAYGKPATALNILRNSIMGQTPPESQANFDFAFRTYAQRWRFRRPQPADFFRTMEDASAIDLDWFWRGWFYTTDHVDLAITAVETHRIESNDRAATARRSGPDRPLDRRKPEFELPEDPNPFRGKDSLLPPETKQNDEAFRKRGPAARSPNSDARTERGNSAGAAESESDFTHYHLIEVENKGGLVMPLILQLEMADNSEPMTIRVPAEIWRRNNERIVKSVFTRGKIKRVRLDPEGETADVDLQNNVFPSVATMSRLEAFRRARQSEEATEGNPPTPNTTDDCTEERED